MKLFRFIRNVWNSAWDTIGDMKGLFQTISIGVIFFALFFGVASGLGWVGKKIGLSYLVRENSRDDIFAIGVAMIAIVCAVSVFCVLFYIIYQKLKEIWDKS
jgi:hypothetical protein